MERCTQYLIGAFISVLMFHPQNKGKGVLNTWLVLLSVYSCFIHKINGKVYSIPDWWFYQCTHVSSTKYMERCTQYLIDDFTHVLMFHPLSKYWKSVLNTWLVISSVYSCFIHKINGKVYSILIGDFISVLMFHPQNKWKGVLNTWLVILSVYSCFIH
jgi:hypothetical protein